MKKKSVRLIILAAVLLIGMLALTGVVLAQSYNFTALDVPNATTTLPKGVNNSGDVVGNYFGSSMYHAGFLYKDGAFTTFTSPLGVNGTYPSGINDRGDIVGDYADVNGSEHGFLYSGGEFTTIDDPNGQYGGTAALGINNSDQVVGYYQDINGRYHGFVYSGGKFTTLDYPGADTSGSLGTQLSGINDRGEIVGYYEDSSGTDHGFLYNDGAFTPIDNPNSVYGTRPTGINDSGEIVGFDLPEASSSSTQGFLYSGGVYKTIAGPGGVNDTAVFGVNNSGDIVGNYTGNGGGGFLAAPAWLGQDIIDSGNGWYYLNWFGFFNTNRSPWIYHQALGWLYPYGTSTDSIWFWDPGMDGLFWTTGSQYPYIYSVKDGSWLYYAEGTSNPCWFYNFSTKKWESY